MGSYLKLGKGEELGGGRTRASIQADAVESVLAAVYLDGGISAARRLIQHFILNHISRVHDAVQGSQDRSAGAGSAQERPGSSPMHWWARRGPDHAKTFRMEVLLNGESHRHRRGPQQKRGRAERRRCRNSGTD